MQGRRHDSSEYGNNAVFYPDRYRDRKRALSKALKDSVKKSFNRITIDGDMSTNDTALIMHNGMLGNSEIKENSASYKIFKNALDEITYELSRLIVKDGEGATKLITIEVKGAIDEKEAQVAASSVANSKSRKDSSLRK